jgi:BASS family bile acid:Na+ symporter
MLRDIVVIVLVPVALGVAANRLVGRRLGAWRRSAPLVSVFSIALIIAIIVARNHDALGTVGPVVVLAVALHNGLGLFIGYTGAKLLKLDEAECRTIAIEVGMQNSGLGVVLASRYFSPLAALPGAVFSVWHNLSGSLLAAWWSRSSAERPSPEGR